ncbi:hypothetical protein [Fontibacillus sp. BL9]|uniref:hypothetical protein n=1 Tax=Fontibacillus sp. BL9 TaxID=3389971 RepID=UPI0039785D17
MSLLLREYRIIGLNMIWIPVLVTLIYSVMIFTVPDHPPFLITIYAEFVMPIIGAVFTGYLIQMEGDRLIELLLTLRKPILVILLIRYLIIVMTFVLISLLYIFFIRVTYNAYPIPIYLGAIIPPLLLLSSLSLLFSILFKSNSLGSMSAALVWGIQLIAVSLKRYEWFEYMFLFETYYLLDSPLWIWNRAFLIFGTILIWVLIAVYTAKRERVLK